MKVRTGLCALLILVALPLGAGERLSLKASPVVSFAPANLVVRTTIEADAANRAMEVVADSSEFYRSSSIELDGARAPRTRQFEFRSLPPGRYLVKATLLGGDGRPRAYVRQEVSVMASAGAR